jgi:hypothetical protein
VFTELTYALKDGKLIHISEVESGSKSGCICPACGCPVSARKGKKRAHEFIHYKSKPKCLTRYDGVRAVRYIIAKEIIEEEGKLYMPDVYLRTATTLLQERTLLMEGMYVSIDAVEFNDKYNGLILHSAGKKMIVELFDEDWFWQDDEKNMESILSDHYKYKNYYYRDPSTSVLAIYISYEDEHLTKDYMKTTLLERQNNRKWIYNTISERYKSYMMQHTHKIPAVCGVIHPSDCPLNINNKIYHLTFESYCYRCKYIQCYDVSSYDSRYTIYGIYCSAKSGIATLDDLIKPTTTK